jgi:hypothetical protein
MHRLVAARRANGLIARAAGPEKAGDTRLFVGRRSYRRTVNDFFSSARELFPA